MDESREQAGVSRRRLMAAGLAGGAGLILSGQRVSAGDSAAHQTRAVEGAFAFVHLTDQHVTDRRHGHEGYRKCIEAINALRPAPDFVLMGGDMVFDGIYTEKANYENQIRLFKGITAELKYPWHPCMGNHDVLGWSSREKVSPSDPDYGKKRIMEALEWPRSYYSFDHKSWHFVVLDSAYPVKTPQGIRQEPRIGKEQLEWLGHDLGLAGDRPKIVVVHIAAFCNMGQINGDPKYLAMDGNMVLWDTKDLRKVLERHKVKLLLQGHSHRVEDTFWNGVWYVTSPAASGAWWAGSWTGSDPGYSILRCNGDQVSWTHESYPWEPHLDPQDTVERQRIADQNAERAEQQRLLQLEQAGRA